MTDGKWTEFLPPILSINEFEQSLAKNSTEGFRISLDDNLNLVSCKKCLKRLLESALPGHLEICAGKPPEKEVFVKPDPIQLPMKVAEIPPPPVAAPIILKKPVKKRKVPAEVSVKPKETKKAKSTAIFNLDVQCGVVTENGTRCARSITCKMHAVTLKRAVPGRSNTYDFLFSDYVTKQLQAKKGAVVEKRPVEYFAAEADVMKLLDIIQNNKPRSYLSNQMNFSIATIISNRNKQSLLDAFKLSKNV